MHNVGHDMDRLEFMNRLLKHYNEDDMSPTAMKRMACHLKRDLRSLDRLECLVQSVQYPVDELLGCCSYYFPKVFTRFLIRKLRRMLRKPQE